MHKKIKGTISNKKRISIAISLLALLVVFDLAAAGISKGDNIEVRQSFSAMGTVAEVSSSVLTLSINGSSRAFDSSAVEKIESKSYVQLSLGDIMSGDTVIVQGFSEDGTISLNRIIDMTWTDSRPLASTSTDESVSEETALVASSTDEIIASSTSEIIASTTDAVSTTTMEVATSTVDAASSASEQTDISAGGSASSSDQQTLLNDSASQAPDPSNAPQQTSDPVVLQETSDESGGSEVVPAE